ncbi:MAG: ABC transporter permease, partial [Spirochaetaceae bacterium]|nr:ABC transporter permease [Spirochaetaceae bacterium]
YNIGGLGQMRIGGIAAIIVTFEFAALPAVLLIPLTLVLCIVAAGGYGAVCGVLYNRYETNPIISTTMLNFVSHYLLLSVTTSQRYGDIDSGHPMSELVPASGTLPGIGQFPTVTLLVTVLVVVSVFVLMKRSALGYQIEATGHNPHASQTYGMNTKRLVVVVLFLGGACAGLAGTLQVIGIQGRLIEGFAITSGAEYGTFGILTALLSGGSPIGVVFASLFMAVLLVGADAMQRTIQVPVEIVFLMQTLMVVIIVTIRKRMGVIQSDG